MTVFRFLRAWLPVSLAVFAVTAGTLWLRIDVVRLCGGLFVYPVDDTYIHIALAKNLAECGVWGVEPGVCSFCSSSPLWTVLLSLFYLVFGVLDDLPWYLAHFFNIASILVFDRLLARYGVSGLSRFALDLGVSISGPFFCTTALGMEHSMHAFFLIAAVAAVDQSEKGGKFLVAGLLSFCATATRYESLFFLLPFLLGVAMVRRDVRWFLIAWLSVLPVLLYGLFASCAGGMFLPNSLMLKGSFLTLGGVVEKVLGLFVEIPLFCDWLYLLGGALLLTACLPNVRPFWRVTALAGLVAIAGHLVFAKVILQLCRYEAYLMSLGTLVVFAALATSVVRNRLSEWLRLIVPCLFLSVLVSRAWLELPFVVHASEDIFSQQVQMTRIMGALPESERGRVAITDLGYFSLHSGLPILDLWGLGTQKVADEAVRLRRLGQTLGTEGLTAISESMDVRYGVFFESWYPLEKRPRNLTIVARLHLEGNFICGDDTVAFFVRNSEDAPRLRAHLLKFVRDLPPRARLEIL